jgi:hypothetical protein
MDAEFNKKSAFFIEKIYMKTHERQQDVFFLYTAPSVTKRKDIFLVDVFHHVEVLYCT